MRVTSSEFVEKLERSGLFTPEQVTSLRASLRRDEHHQDGKILARKLVREGRLTKFQAQSVYQGNLKGLVLGDYTILEKIGAGGMGDVYKARHRRMKRVVAVKVLPDAATQSPDLLRRFYREVEAAATLSHPNIVTAYDASEHNEIHYLVMEYVDGQDLSAVLKQHGVVPVQQAVECILQAAQGLAYSHTQGIVHRDIKPGNLLLHRDGTVKILDMGLARVSGSVERIGVDDDTAEELTSNGQVLGTCDYMAPEQAEDSHQADPRSDIYSLGCTLYRLLTGQSPYKRDSIIETLVAHRQSPIPSLCETRDDMPASLDAVFQKMVAKSPDDRQQSMTEVVAELTICLRPEAAEAVSPSSESSSDDALQSFLEHLPEDPITLRQLAKPVRSHADKGSALNLSETKHDSGSSVTMPASSAGESTAVPSFTANSSPPVTKERSTARWANSTRLWLVLSACISGFVLLLGLALIVIDVTTRNKDGGEGQQAAVAASDQWTDAQDASGAVSDDADTEPVAASSSTSQPTGTGELILSWPVGERENARLQIDDQTIDLKTAVDPADANPLRLTLSAGKHRIWIDRRGHSAFQTDVALARDQEITLTPSWPDAELADAPSQPDSSIPPPDASPPGEVPLDPNMSMKRGAADSVPVPINSQRDGNEPALAAPAEASVLAQYRALENQYVNALQPGEALVGQWEFEAAAQAIAGVQFAQQELAERLAVRRTQIQHMSAMKRTIVHWVNQAESLTKRDLGLSGVGGDSVDGADEHGLMTSAAGNSPHLHRWHELGSAATTKLLGLSIDRQKADDWLAAGLVADAIGDHKLARESLSRARVQGGDVDAHFSELAATCFSHVLQMMDEGQFRDALAALDEIEEGYAQSGWFTTNRPVCDAARRAARIGIRELDAQALFDQAVTLLAGGERFDLRDVVDQLETQYKDSRVVNDPQQNPSFIDLQTATASLGPKLIVRRDGTGDHRTIQAAIDAAGRNALIEIADAGPYNENLVILRGQDDLTIRGAEGVWPVITSEGPKSDFPVLVTADAARTTLQRLALLHTRPAGTPMRCLSIQDGSVKLRSSIVVMGLSPEAVWISGSRGQCDIEDTLVWAEVMVNSARLSAKNSVFGLGTIVVNGGSCQLRNVTASGTVQLSNPASVLLDSILTCIDVRQGRHRIDHCDVFGTQPYLGQAAPGPNCINKNPMLRNPAQFDFGLMSKSPCRGVASDGGDLGCRPTEEVQAMCAAAAKLAAKGVLKLQVAGNQ